MMIQSVARRSVAILVGLLVCVAGCSDSARQGLVDDQVSQASHLKRSPKDFLADIFKRYRNASTYHDEGMMRVSFDHGGRWESEVTPLSVSLEYGRLQVRAYDAHIFSDRSSFRAWMTDSATDQFDSQVLTRGPIDGRPQVESLVFDPVLAEKIGDGMAGPPPQLEWLFAPQPMHHLFDDGHRFRFGKEGRVDDHPCVSVEVDASGDRFRFWIDPSQGLIRRVDLPAPAAGQSDIASQSGTNGSRAVALSLELTDATFDASGFVPDLSSMPKRPRPVSNFVPLPPPRPDDRLAGKASPFRLASADRSFTLSQNGSDRPVTILMRYAGEARSIESVGTLVRWVAMMPPALAARVRTVLVLDRGVTNPLPGQVRIPVITDDGGVLASNYRLQPGALVLLADDGSVAWFQPELPQDSVVQLGAIVADLLSGIDVPGRCHAQWNEAVDAYHDQLRQHRVRQNSAN